MAHYSTSPKLLRECDSSVRGKGYYGSMGPCEADAVRVRFIRDCKPKKHISAFQVLLQVVKSKRWPKRKTAYNKWAHNAKVSGGGTLSD